MSTASRLGNPATAVLPILALLVTGVASTLVLVGLPVLVGGLADQYHWGDIERGWFASADMTGSALACLVFIRSVARLDWRLATRIALLVVAAANLACIYVHAFPPLIALRVVAGFGNGVVLSIVFTGLCHSSAPDRYFGFYVLAQLVLQALLLAILPGMIAASGMASAYVLLAVAAVLGLLLAGLFPPGLAAAPVVPATEPPATSAGDEHAPRVRAIAALCAQAIYFLAVAALWGYFEGIGRGFSLSMAQIGNALAVSALAGMVGSVVVIALGARAPRVASIAVGTVASIAAALLLLEGGGAVRYLISACLFNFAWNYTFPYQMGVLAGLDRQGSVAVTSLLVQLAGLALGPLLAAAFLAGTGYGAILYACSVGFAVSFIMFAWSGRP